MEQIILASGSPRRQEFFRLMGLPFICLPSLIDETPKQGLNPRQIAEDLAVRKVLAVAGDIIREEHKEHKPLFPSPQCGFTATLFPIPWIFGADTIVVLNDKIYGKPDNRADAKQMLEQLAGKKHEVITAIALHNRQEEKTNCRSVSSNVEFSSITNAEIEWYLDTNEWEGAAGAYRLQELGGCLVKSINGSPSGVAGLPLHDFYVMLRDSGYRFGA